MITKEQITDEILKQFKERIKISHSSEDDSLKRSLATSYNDILSKCGVFDLNTPNRGMELVFERSRYVYNDALEYFKDNFLSSINSFALDNLPDEKEGDDASEQVQRASSQFW